MTTNYNFEPYYDDFVDTKNYVKVLFKPGVAVQARELTQIQTAIQQQIKSMGGFLFKNESLVSGGKASAYVVNWIDVASSDLSSYVGKNLVGVTSKAKAKVVTYKNSVSSGVSRLYFVYTNGNKFGKAETLNQDTTFPEVQSIVTLDTDTNTGPALAYSMTQAVFFVKDYFVVSPEQTVIVGDSLTPTAKIGLEVVEEVVTYQDDETLLDPASGSYNYAAPGADRVAITLTLTVYPYNVIEGTDADEIVDTTDNFIEVARYVAGVSAFQLTDPTLGGLEDVFARRTFDESGDYTVRSFAAKAVNNVYRQQDLLSISIEPGKAYVKGYEFETKSTLHLDLEKSRDYKDLSNFYGEAAFGDYFLIGNPTGGILSYTENPEITFTGATGTARVRGVERVNSTQIKLFVYNVRVTTGAIKDITAVNAGTWTASVFSTNPDKLYKAKNGAYLISMNNSPIKDVVDISYTTQTMVSGNATATTLSPTSSLPSGKTYVSSIPEDYVVVKQSDGTVVTGFTVTVSGGQTFTLTGTFTNGATYNVFAKVAVSTPTTKSKIRTTTTVYLTNSNATKITLGVSDCYKIVSIIARSSVNLGDMLDVTGRYTLLNGQTDSLYDYGSIVLKSRTIPAPLTQYNRLAVTLEYFEESQNAGFFTGNSYNTTTTDSSLVVPYENIQSYTTTSGVTYSLRDVFDFRPRRDKIATFPGTLAAPIGSTVAATITGNEFIKPSSSITCDYSYYIPRIDKLIVTKEKKFDLIRGIPSEIPQIPSDSPDAMTLYTVFVPAYTFRAADVAFNYIENRRYTMRDIGKIDKRVNRLEYYTAMSLLEKQAADETIVNSAGIDKFKNGILVDSFAGFGVSDVGSAEYSCSIDTLTRTLRPRFASDSFLFEVDTTETNSTYYSKKSDLLTLPYTSATYVENTQATNWSNLNPYMVFKWNGEVVLSPSSDVWSDKETLPDVVTNINGANDAFTILANDVVNPASTGVKWADWQLVDKGIVVNTSASSVDNVSYYLNNGRAIQSTATTTTTTKATTVTDTYYANGLSVEKSAVSSIVRDLGSKVVDASIIPYIRSAVIDFSASKLKPDTVLFASFDGVDVTRYCAQAPVIYTTTVANATKVRKVGTSKTADILKMRSDRAFVKMYPDEYMFSAGDILEWFVGTNWVVSGTVSDVIVPNSYGLATDENGDVAGYFYLPNNESQRFRTGERSFLLADTLGIQATTAAESKYVAQGMSMSLQKDIISTQVQTVEINPVSKTENRSNTTVALSSNTVITNKDVTVLCGQTQSGAGARGKFVYELDFGTDIGSCGINYDPSGIPDRYTIVWNGNTYTSGFRGFSTFGGGWSSIPLVDYDKQLNSLGFPSTTSITDTNNPSAGKLRFTKTSIFPNKAILIVDAPLSGTQWAYKAICPGKTDNLLPETDPKIQVIVDTPATHNAAWGATSVTYNVTVRVVGTQNVPTGTPVNITGFGRIEQTNGRWQAFASGTRITGPSSGQVSSFPFATTVGSTLTYTVSYDTTANARTQGITVQNSLRSPTNTISFSAQLVTPIDGFSASTSGSDTTTITQSLPAPPPSSSSSFGRGCGDDPLAQTFFVSAANNPDGIFIDAVDVFFRSKPVSDNVAVSLNIRPTVNGYPSSTEVLPFATSDILSKDVVVSSDATVNKAATRFQLKAPVYLAPNTEYAIVLRTNSTEFEVFTSVIGSFLLSNSTTRATKQPGTGSLFLSSNGTTWTAEQASSMLFRVKKCVFPTNTNSAVVLNTKIPENKRNGSYFSYDMFFMDGEVLDFASTNVNYSFRPATKISFLDTNYVKDSSYTQYQLGSNVALPNRKSLSMTDKTTLKTKVSLTTTNADVSPVVDMSRLSTVLVQNIINNNSNSETSQTLLTISSITATSGAGTGVVTITTSGAHGLSVGDYVEIAADTTNQINGSFTIASTPLTTTFTYTRVDSGTAFTTAQTGFVTRKAQAYSRYITRKVTLNQDFYSSDIKAYFYASIPTGCSVIPYYKAATVSDINIEDNNWIPMRLESSGTADRNGFVEYKYKAAYDISADTFALPAGDKFGSFVVKLVMLSSDTTKVPLIRDLRVLALDD